MILSEYLPIVEHLSVRYGIYICKFHNLSNKKVNNKKIHLVSISLLIFFFFVIVGGLNKKLDKTKKYKTNAAMWIVPDVC